MDIFTCNLRWRLRVAPLFCSALLLLMQVSGEEAATNSITIPAVQVAHTNYQLAIARFHSQPDNAEAALAAGRACFELGEYASKKAERAHLANEGIAACERALALRTNFGAAHYYLGMNLGQLARTKGWAALNMVGRLEAQFAAAARLDPNVDYGGPDRNLGYLYRDTPSFSIGDKHQAAQHFEKAVKLAPAYPENRLALIEGLLKWHERKEAREELKALEQILPEARARFSGPAYEANWVDWDQRLGEVRTKAHEQKKFLGIFGGDD